MCEVGSGAPSPIDHEVVAVVAAVTVGAVGVAVVVVVTPNAAGVVWGIHTVGGSPNAAVDAIAAAAAASADNGDNHGGAALAVVELVVAVVVIRGNESDVNVGSNAGDGKLDRRLALRHG